MVYGLVAVQPLLVVLGLLCRWQQCSCKDQHLVSDECQLIQGWCENQSAGERFRVRSCCWMCSWVEGRKWPAPGSKGGGWPEYIKKQTQSYSGNRLVEEIALRDFFQGRFRHIRLANWWWWWQGQAELYKRHVVWHHCVFILHSIFNTYPCIIFCTWLDAHNTCITNHSSPINRLKQLDLTLLSSYWNSVTYRVGYWKVEITNHRRYCLN